MRLFGLCHTASQPRALGGFNWVYPPPQATLALTHFPDLSQWWFFHNRSLCRAGLHHLSGPFIRPLAKMKFTRCKPSVSTSHTPPGLGSTPTFISASVLSRLQYGEAGLSRPRRYSSVQTSGVFLQWNAVLSRGEKQVRCTLALPVIQEGTNPLVVPFH